MKRICFIIILWAWSPNRTFWENFKYNFLTPFCTIGELLKWEVDDDILLIK